ncbi:MAG: lectin, partial [Acidobacteriota bacterium]|nr:lectin [Acidobacteriota bacterium]
MTRTRSFGIALLLAMVMAAPAATQSNSMSFFITSAGPGDGANLGGLEGADAHCSMLA